MVVFAFAVTARGVYDLHQSVLALERSTEDLEELVFAMEQAEQTAYDEAIEKSLEFAPEGHTLYQLRGFAQTQAQQLLDQLTDHYFLPRHELNSIRFVPVLRDGAAGTASPCTTEEGTPSPTYTISLNEILFLRNYEEFMEEIIPHEVAHVITCLNGEMEFEPGEDFWSAVHGEEWIEAMLVLGFLNPEKMRTHNLDDKPVHEFQRNYVEILTATMEDAKNVETE